MRSCVSGPGQEATGVGMSERMSSVEIEDVLSSIRRLVTEDLRPKPPAMDEKLLLTPALRVVPAVAAVEAIADPVETAAEDVEDAADIPVFIHQYGARHSAAAPDLAEAVTSIGAAVPDDGYESETGEAGPADAMPVPDWPEASWVAPDVISDVDEAEVVAQPGDLPGWAQAEDLDLPGKDLAAEAAEAPYTHAGVDEAGLDDLAVDDAAVEEADFDPNGDLAEAAALAALAAEDDLAETQGLMELDEDMLRDIVRDIIHQELHGSLGERITRNVRKLVRAEISRAMATRDLE